MDGTTEGDRPAMLGDLLQSGCTAVGQHEVGLRDAEFLQFLFLFHFLVNLTLRKWPVSTTSSSCEQRNRPT